MASDIDLLMQEFLPSKEKVLAEKLRRRQQADALGAANEKGHSMDLLNFVAGVSNNEGLAKSMGVLTKSNQERYKPVQMGQSGFMLPESGEYTESPMYVDQKESDRQAKLVTALQVAQAAKERAAAHDTTLLSIAQGNNQARLLAAAIAAAGRSSATDKAKEKKEKDLDTGVTKLSAAMEKSGIPEVEAGMDTVRTVLSQYKEGKLPGFGRVAGLLPNAMLDDEAQGVRTDMQGLANMILKSRSGAAVTEPEQRRFLTEIGAGKFMDEKTLRRGWDNVFKSLESKRQNILSGANAEVLSEYNKRYGSSYTHGSGAPKGATSAPAGSKKKAIKDMSDEELDAYEKALKGQ